MQSSPPTSPIETTTVVCRARSDTRVSSRRPSSVGFLRAARNQFLEFIVTFVMIQSILRQTRTSTRVAAFSPVAVSAFQQILPARYQYNLPQTRRTAPNFPRIKNAACFSSSSDKQDHGGKSKKRTGGSKKKYKVNPAVSQANADKLAAAFDEMARKEGFDDSSALFADDASFEDDFDYDEEIEDDVAIGADDELDPNDFDIGDFEEDDDDFLDFGGDSNNVDDEMSMEERIAAAKRDMDLGRVTVPDELDTFSKEVTTADLRKLGFRRELNPFGNDETPRRNQFNLITNAMECSACGSDFQSQDELRPGYLPPEKMDLQIKLAKLEEMQKLQERADNSLKEWSVDDEIEYLLQTSGGTSDDGAIDEMADLDIDAVAESMGLDLLELSKKKVICKRCHGLQNFGKVETSLRPGWTKEPMLSQEKFRDLLRPLREKPAVIIALVDLFDFSGSVLSELDAIAGDNPVILAANKADLLPSKMGQARAENWVRRELEYMGIQSIANIGGAVRLVSCKTGFGVQAMLSKARKLADDMDCDVYVVGAANAGKSTLINHILDKKDSGKDSGKKRPGKVRAGNANARKGALTTSPLPGTTLKFIKVDIGDGKKLFDTPGLLVPGTLTQLLTPEELKIVVPRKQVEPITFRVASGKCVLVGGLARIEVIGDSKPFLFTFFVANDIKLHPTDAARADEFISKHAGGMLTPPLEPGPERMAQIGEFESHEVDIEGAGWKEAAADISLCGLGWVAVTGAGTANVKITVPKGIGVSVRPPLMPFDVWEVAASYTGGRAVRKSTKSKTGKRRKGVGRN